MKSEDQSETFKLRLEARLKNAELIRVREKLGLSQRQIAEEIGICCHVYNGYENLRVYPSKKTLDKIATFFKKKGIYLDIEEVFPEELRQFKNLSKIIAERRIPRTKILNMSSVSPKALETATYKLDAPGKLLEAELKQELKKHLNNLNDRERKILILRYGLGEEEPISLKKVSKEIGKSIERVRQLELIAINKIRKHMDIYIR